MNVDAACEGCARRMADRYLRAGLCPSCHHRHEDDERRKRLRAGRLTSADVSWIATHPGSPEVLPYFMAMRRGRE